MTDLLLVDVETVHLDAFEGSVWEIAWAPLDGPIHSHLVSPSLMKADPKALEVGRFMDRFDLAFATPRDELADHLAEALTGRPALAGSAPWFDAAHISVNWPALAGLWHHHHVDVPTLICGASHQGDAHPPWRLSQAAEHAGLDLDGYDRHTAAGDVALARDLYRLWSTGGVSA